VGLAGTDVNVAVGARDVEVGTGVVVEPTGVRVGVACSMPSWNVPLQAMMTIKRITADKIRVFMEPPDLDRFCIYLLF
jgi:hypothetical protein